MNDQIPALLLVPQHLVSLTTLGITSALVLDVGYKEAVAVPIIEGVTILDALQYAPLGGKSIHFRIMDELFQRNAIIREKGTENVISEQLDEKTLEDIKIRTCFVAPFEKGIELANQKVESSRVPSPDSKLPCDVSYPIKGDKVLVIPGSLRESVCEVMFEMYGEEQTIPTLLMDAIIKCPVDARKQLSSNIVLIGGSTMLPGFKHRLMMELKMLAESQRYEPKIHFKEFKFHELPCKENYASWLGASIFGSTEALTIRSITREHYLKSNGKVQDWNDWIPSRS
jgi:actin-related protein 10